MDDLRSISTPMLEFKRNTLDDQIVEIEHSLTLTQSKLITMYNKSLLEKKQAEMELIDRELEYRKEHNIT